MFKNISLIGMPAAGKSTVGVILAKYMNMEFIDTDIIIQMEKGMRLHEIIDQQGLEKFCKTEGEIVSSIKADSAVIATGGSVVYSENAMKHLKNIGRIVYLETSFEVVEKRLMNLHDRGVVHRSDQSVLDLYEERVPLYEKWCDFTVDTSSGRPEDVVSRIMSESGVLR